MVAENGKVKKVIFKKCVSVFDENHKFSPKYDEDDLMELDADFVLAAIGQSIQWGGLLDGTKVTTNRNGTAQADEWTYQTAEPDIFVGGDVYTGPNFAIRAIAAGKAVAANIDAYLGFGHDVFDDVRIPQAIFDSKLACGRVNVQERSAAERATDFAGVEIPLRDEEADQECGRCLRCDHFGMGSLRGGRPDKW
jgi:NADPH-dependent glutamate synthase beta subunit-like oxidoreductase